MPTHPLLGRKLLVVTAHPDDESYLAAGTIYANYRAGGETVLLCATRGEKGTSHLKRPLPEERFKRMRERELRRACRTLRVKSIHLLGFPDGRLRENERKYYREILRVARRVRPDAVLGFGSDGMTGHRDHIAAGKAARHAARQLGIPFFAAAMPPRLRRLSVTWIMSRWRAPHYRKRALNHGEHSLRVPVDRRMKERAVSCHASQMDGPAVFEGFPKHVAREFLRAEYFTET